MPITRPELPRLPSVGNGEGPDLTTRRIAAPRRRLEWDKIDLSRRLAADAAGAEDVAVYHPREPARVLLLSSFTPALEVGDCGR